MKPEQVGAALEEEDEKHHSNLRDLCRQAGVLEINKKNNVILDIIKEIRTVMNDIRNNLSKLIYETSSRKRLVIEDYRSSKSFTIRDGGIYDFSRSTKPDILKIINKSTAIEDTLEDHFSSDEKLRDLKEKFSKLNNLSWLKNETSLSKRASVGKTRDGKYIGYQPKKVYYIPSANSLKEAKQNIVKRKYSKIESIKILPSPEQKNKQDWEFLIKYNNDIIELLEDFNTNIKNMKNQIYKLDSELEWSHI